jgi:hypothetical protein
MSGRRHRCSVRARLTAAGVSRGGIDDGRGGSGATMFRARFECGMLIGAGGVGAAGCGFFSGAG